MSRDVAKGLFRHAPWRITEYIDGDYGVLETVCLVVEVIFFSLLMNVEAELVA